MRELRFGPGGKARVWQGCLPPYGSYESISTKVIEAQASPSHQMTSRVGAIDWYRHAGLFNHAMLGGEFTPSSEARWRVIVPISKPDGPLIRDTILGNDAREQVRAGLPDFLDKGLELAARELENGNELLAGTLTISHAAHSNISATVWGFQRAMICLVRILQTEPSDLTDDALRALLERP